MEEFALNTLDPNNPRERLTQLKYDIDKFWEYGQFDRSLGGGRTNSECRRILAEKNVEIKKLEKEIFRVNAK